MEPNILVKRQIDEFKVGIAFIFDDYSESKFKKDLQELRQYHDKEIFPGKKDLKEMSQEEKKETKESLKKELDFKFYSTKNFDKIDYELFKTTIADLFSKMFFYMMEHNNELMTSTEFTLQILIRRIPGGEFYFGYGDDVKVSDPENVCCEASGFWLTQNVVLPYVNGQNAFSIIQRYIMHELTLHGDEMKKKEYEAAKSDISSTLKKFVTFEADYKEKIKRLYLKNSAYFLNCLYTSLFDLREEGLADFYARKNSSKIDINTAGIKQYNANLVKLSMTTRRREAEAFYEKEISYRNLTPSNEYTMGRNMCLTIALALSKKGNIPFTVGIGDRKFNSKEVKDFNGLLKNNTILYIEDLDQKMFIATVEKVRPLAHYTFVKEYEDACKELGIHEENMIMTRRRFYNIITSSIARVKKEKTARLQSRGFKYVEDDIKQI